MMLYSFLKNDKPVANHGVLFDPAKISQIELRWNYNHLIREKAEDEQISLPWFKIVVDGRDVMCMRRVVPEDGKETTEGNAVATEAFRQYLIGLPRG